MAISYLDILPQRSEVQFIVEGEEERMMAVTYQSPTLARIDDKRT